MWEIIIRVNILIFAFIFVIAIEEAKVILLSAGDDNCMTGEARLMGKDTSSSGVVEVCVDGVWGVVCDYPKAWSHENAAVVCRQLNLPTSGISGPFVLHDKYFNIIIGANPLPDSNISFASSYPVLFDSVHCFGNEEKILYCPHSSVGNHFCSQFYDGATIVAVECKCEFWQYKF